MKHSTLKLIARYLQNFKSITSIKRVEDTIIKIVFDTNETVFFDMRKGDAFIFKKEEFTRAKVYNAPFDVVLSKRLSRAKIEHVEVLENNRILRITTSLRASYKTQKTILQLEFTGKNTNSIILDENDIILEALRHIDLSVSSRSVKVGERLQELPPFDIKEKPEIIENLENFLKESYDKRSAVKLGSIKAQKIKTIEKKIKKFRSILDGLQNEDSLHNKAKTYNSWGTLILSNLDKIKSYQTNIKLADFDGNEVDIVLPKEARDGADGANILFSSSKKLKKKAKSLHIEKQNLQEKIEFLQKMQQAISKTDDESKINILYPKQKQQKKTKTPVFSYESFYMEGFKIMLGKNEKGNIELLRESKKRDIWMHLKDIPSSHVIIRTDKQSVPLSILEFGAKLCVDFSTDKQGQYLVDYTQRRNVKIKEGANVNYVEYKTISMSKE